jgi:hypothetical protein
MVSKKVLVKGLIVLACLIMSSAPTVLARTCNGDFDYDGDVDGSDAFLFKQDFFKFDCTNKPALVPKTG